MIRMIKIDPGSIPSNVSIADDWELMPIDFIPFNWKIELRNYDAAPFPVCVDHDI